jgi:hypothetical protein
MKAPIPSTRALESTIGMPRSAVWWISSCARGWAGAIGVTGTIVSVSSATCA